MTVLGGGGFSNPIDFTLEGVVHRAEITTLAEGVTGMRNNGLTATMIMSPGSQTPATPPSILALDAKGVVHLEMMGKISFGFEVLGTPLHLAWKPC